MYTINRVQLTGNLGGDPEMKSFESGTKVAKFSIATREEFNTRSGEKSTKTEWHNITAWGQLADKIVAEFRKGSFVSVEGRLTTRNFTDKNGVKRYITEVVATDAVLNIRKEAQAA
jgi:single-strand DNA-binding protein